MTAPSMLASFQSAQRTWRGRTRRGEVAAIALLLGALLFVPYVVPPAILNDLSQGIVLGIFAIAFNILLKYSGLLSFGHAAYFGFAAYAEALLLRSYPLAPVPLLVMIAGATSATLGLVLGHICMRRSGAYFSMTTLAIAAFFYTTAFKWQAVTGGTDGLDGFMPASLVILPGFALANASILEIYMLVLGFLIPIALAVWALLELTPFGNAVQLIRQNEERAAFLGYDTHKVKLANFVLATFLAGIAGALWAIVNRFVSTDSIDLTLSTTVIIMSFIGGTSWLLGPLIGSTIYIFASDRLSLVTQHWQLWLGLAFIVLVLVFPRGVAGLVEAAFNRVARRHDA